MLVDGGQVNDTGRKAFGGWTNERSIFRTTPHHLTM